MVRARGPDKNEIIVQGIVVRAPKFYETNSRGRELRFTLITEGVFVDIVSPAKSAEICEGLRKGQKVRIEGRLRQRRRDCGGKRIPTVHVEPIKVIPGRISS